MMTDTVRNIYGEEANVAATFAAQEVIRSTISELKEIENLRAQLAERDAQLAAERAMADMLQTTLLFVTTYPEADTIVKKEALRSYDAHLASRQPTQGCPSCGGNDSGAPCAYPSEGMRGCLRDKRLDVSQPTQDKGEV
jgi:hypothetical protein